MILIVQRRVGGQTAFQILLDLIVVGLEGDPAVAGEDAVRVGIDHEAGHRAGVQQDRIGGFPTDAVNGEQFLSQPAGSVRNIAGTEPS